MGPGGQRGEACLRAERQHERVSGPLGFGTLAVGPERGVRERLGSRERVGRGWTEREVWAEPVWRGLGRSVGELGFLFWVWAGLSFGFGLWVPFLFLFTLSFLFLTQTKFEFKPQSNH